MKPRLSLRKALDDKLLLGKSLAGESWQAWRDIAHRRHGRGLTDEERELFKQSQIASTNQSSASRNSSA